MPEHDPSVELSEIEREELAVYVDPSQPSAPGWFWAFCGLAAGAVIASNDLDNPLASIVIATSVMAALAFASGRIVARAGVQARLGSMPVSFKRRVYTFAVGAALVVLGAYAVAALVLDAPWRFTAAGAVAALAVGGGGWATARSVDAEAARLANEAGIGG